MTTDDEKKICAQCGRELPAESQVQFCELCEAEILAQEMDFYLDSD